MATAIDMNLNRLLGMADAFALLSAAFSYPDDRLAEGLATGSFCLDLRNSLADADLGGKAAEDAVDAIEAAVAGRSAAELLVEMRADYTALYDAPGKYRKIFPYESSFRMKEKNPNAKTTLFLTKSTHDVEQAMRKRGALPESYRREPVDFVATELDFARHLLTGCAAVAQEGIDDPSWNEDARSFIDEHVLSWMPAFFQRTRQLAPSSVYDAFAALGLLVVDESVNAL